MYNLLPKKGETKNLDIKDSSIKECEILQNICELWNETDKEYLEGTKFEKNYIKKCLTEGDLPPTEEATKDLYKLKSIYSKEDGEIIGFFDLYHGYPSNNSIFISILLIAPDFQKQGYAQEVSEYISKESKKAGYEKICIGVYLKNWKALRFWTQSGFNKILGIYGDKDYSNDTYAFMGLEKELKTVNK